MTGIWNKAASQDIGFLLPAHGRDAGSAQWFEDRKTCNAPARSATSWPAFSSLSLQMSSSIPKEQQAAGIEAAKGKNVDKGGLK